MSAVENALRGSSIYAFGTSCLASELTGLVNFEFLASFWIILASLALSTSVPRSDYELDGSTFVVAVELTFVNLLTI